MHLVIAGAGEVGYHLVEALQGEANITVIDLDAEVLKRLKPSRHLRTIQANAAHQETLHKAKVEKADLFVAVTDRDDANLLACLVARQIGSPVTIARVKQLKIDGGGHSPRFKDIDLVINPYNVVAEYLEQLILHPQVTDIDTFMDGEVLLTRIPADESSMLIGETVESFGTKAKKVAPNLIASIQRQQKNFIPHAQETIQAGDQLYFFCPTYRFKRLLRLLHLPKRNTRRVFINGGGNVGMALACRLEQHGLDVRVLEIDPHRCQILSRNLPHSLVLQASGMDLSVLQPEGIRHADYFVSLTADDGLNIAACLLAKEHSNCRTAALFKQTRGLPLINRYGLIDRTFSPRLLTARKILQHMRGRNLRAFSSLENSEIELLEIKLQSPQPCLNIPLHHLKLPKESLVGTIRRRGKIFLPGGEDKLQAEDNLLLIQHRSHRETIRKIFLRPHPNHKTPATAS